MNYINKGNKFEDDIFNYFSNEISNNRFLFKKECCKLFKKKGYYSKDRKKNIFFDVSIEVTLPDKDSYSMLILIECKNYNHRVPVDDIEEFFSKAQQISGCNIKGIVASTNAFQEGAFNFSESKGIGLLRYYGLDDLDWVLTRSPSTMNQICSDINDRKEILRGLQNPDHKARVFDCYGFINGYYTHSLNQFLSKIETTGNDSNLYQAFDTSLGTKSSNFQFVPYMKSSKIEQISEKTLEKINDINGATPVTRLCSLLSRENGLTVFRNSSLEPGVLGSVFFNPLWMKIDDRQAKTNRRVRFTIAHELGHILLDHKKYIKSEIFQNTDIDFKNPRIVSAEDLMRLEWQANFFASCLLLPKSQFTAAFNAEIEKHDLRNRGHGALYLDRQQCNISSFHRVTSSLMNEFNVSKSVVKIRLNKLGLLKENIQDRSKSLNDILSRFI